MPRETAWLYPPRRRPASRCRRRWDRSGPAQAGRTCVRGSDYPWMRRASPLRC